MSNDKQSSVEWLIDQLEEKGDAWENASIRRVNISIDVSEYMELKTKAKSMHKEETLKLYYAYEDYVLREEGIIKTFGQFYNETFNN